MRLTVLLSLSLLCFLPRAHGLAPYQSDDGPLKKAADLVNIRAEGASPFKLEADFDAHVNVLEHGHVIWKWSSAEEWSREVTMAGVKVVEVRKGDKLYISRNLPFTPLRIGELESLMAVFVTSDDWQFKKLRQGTEAGMQLDCIELKTTSKGFSGPKPKRDVCISQLAGEIISDEEKGNQYLNRTEFSAYHSLQIHRYPFTQKLVQNGSVLLKVTVVSLEQDTFSAADFVPPADSVIRTQCKNMIHPVPLKTPDPSYPPGASNNGMTGVSSASVTVKIDGSVENIQIIESAGHDMDQAVRDKLMTWKFKPAMCGNQAVEADIRVEVTFQLAR